ncbi:hypothetical protein CRD14_06940 [Corynebacterium sp. LK27]|nr:hypothetical protein [Corynebacterium sp. LK27]OHR31919.1 hypothetical protein HMPREF2847_10625 [Corynebacterium sp. HMSC074C03]
MPIPHARRQFCFSVQGERVLGTPALGAPWWKHAMPSAEIPGFTSRVGATLLALIEKLIANMQSATSKELRPHD